ncbi:putative exo-beta [Diplodia seriata]|uniref:Putative exo-beta n=1 Tax=Diplodia seriata TaxID=420778 RepID=A0A0G2HIL6_9PEZI|nr:putative exo-beta [Diplodia seriata]
MRGLAALLASVPPAVAAALVPDGVIRRQFESDTTAALPDSSSAFDTFTYPVHRNVLSYGADPSGTLPSTAAIQAAINDGCTVNIDSDSGGSFSYSYPALRNTTGRGPSFGSTLTPAAVYLPPGTYLLDAPLQLWVGTVLVGDAVSPPVLAVSAGFSSSAAGNYVIRGKEPNLPATNGFFVGLRDVVVDSKAYAGDEELVLLDWTVSQGTQLARVRFEMPPGGRHVGMSNVILNDLSFNGGAVGMDLSGQQWLIKSVTFNGCGIGAIVDCYDCVFLDINCLGVGICLDGSQTSGSLTVIDSYTANSGTFVSSYESVNGSNQLVLENIQSDGDTVTLSGDIILRGNVPFTWIRGQVYTQGNPSPSYQQGAMVYTPRSSALTSNGNYFVMKPPTFHEYDSSQILNIKAVPEYPVYGDGNTDDTKSINAILTQYAGCKVIYIPAGTYVVTNTIFIPRGTRIYGDAYASVISAKGPTFSYPNIPMPMVQVGAPGDVGVAQIVDMMFTVGEVLPGCKLVEVNMAGEQPGDVALINSHMRVGGAARSAVQTSCEDASPCRAAWCLIHLTAQSSAYVENVWGWTADHDLDGIYTQNIATGRGMLVEATKGTWMVGTSMEHNTLYQYNFNAAQSVFAAMQQSETPYWQGVDSGTVAPYPWTDALQASDPDFSHCPASSGGYCGAALFERIAQSKSLFLYGGCLWTFFTGGNESEKCDSDCQQEAIDIDNASSGIYLYGTNVHKVTNMVRSGGWSIAGQSTNEGGWGGVVAAYLYNS